MARQVPSLMNPPSLLLARTPPVPSTSTSTHVPSARSDYAFPPHAYIATPQPSTPGSPSAIAHPPVQLHPVFCGGGPLPGTVEITVETTTFRVHKEVLAHASGFFETLLCGEWAETANTAAPEAEGREGGGGGDSGGGESRATSIDGPEPPHSPPPTFRGAAALPHPHPHQHQQLQSHRATLSDSFVTAGRPASSLSSSSITPLRLARPHSPPQLARPPQPPPLPADATRDQIDDGDDARTVASSSYVDEELGLSVELPPPCGRPKLEARVHLREEKAAAFQDLLMFVYPQLECICTWNNAPELMTMSRKFDMPLLQRHVMHFLLSSAAGKPIQAMKIAEDHCLADLYRESSRFLLDNWSNWDPKELETLSSDTLLKLEKKRNWFLERLLKLGLVNSSRDYVCPPSCPDRQHCARLVEDKWRSAWTAAFKFGPPQPSGIYRALRSLEPSLHSPALMLPHTACQQHAVRFFADLFDRMFSQFTRTNGDTGIVGLGLGVGANTGPEGQRRAKYFLCVSLWEGKERPGHRRGPTTVIEA